ncbi:hypothetical protein [Streptodolium elevatio]|uniref:Uncharacterized protein n=1 Tax=Streptodolium elevatio TaxID=3157996 RepID=A0ABV3DBW5_9ACTN
MATTPKAFYRGSLPAAQTTVYTVPASTKAIVTNVVATNPGTSSALVTVKLDNHSILASVGIAAKGVLTLELAQVIEAGSTISVQGGTPAASVHISGVEVA